MTVLSFRSTFRRFALILFPWRGAAGEAAVVSMLMWSLHALIWGSVLIGSWQMNRWGGLERWLRSSWPTVHHVWLPVVVVLVYVFGWLAAGLWHALRCDPHQGACPDVEAAWNEAWRHLEKTYLYPRDTPLFLFLGPLTLDLQALLEQAGAACVLPRAAAPLHVFAHPEAIFVIAGSISKVGRQGSRMLEAPFPPTSRHEDSSARLRHWCELACRDRPGLRALQGIVLVVPPQTLKSDASLRQAVAWCQDDLREVRQATGLECPLHVALAGLSGVPECAAEGWFQRLPLMPDCEPEEVAAALEQGIDNLLLEKIPQQVRRQMRLNTAPSSPGVLPDALRENIDLYLYLAAMQDWRGRLCRLLTEATWNEYEEPGLLAGCYLLPDGTPHLSKEGQGEGGVGAAGRRSTVFHTLVADLLANQQAVTLTPETWAQRARERQITRRGYGAVLAGWASVVAIVGWFFATRN
jgi:hypothetical protein